MSIWTVHVSNADTSYMAGQVSTLMTTIFPEQDNSCAFLIQENSDAGMVCKRPLGYHQGKQLPGLMTLKSFVEGGAEALHAKILVCVKSIGGRKSCKLVLSYLACLTKVQKSHNEERKSS